MTLRPGLRKFIVKLAKHFELILFNSDNQPFTEAVFKKMIEILQDNNSKLEEKNF